MGKKVKGSSCTIREIVKDIFGFDVGDKILFQKKLIGRVVAKVEGVEKPYGITYVTPKGEIRTTFTVAGQLSSRKGFDELEVGDKFISDEGFKLKVLFVGYDEMVDKVDYYCRTLDGTCKGMTCIKSPDEVEEIIYG